MSYLIAIAAPLHEEARNPSDTIAHAIWLLKGQGLVVTTQSALHRLPSGQEGDGPDVVSMVLDAKADKTPASVSSCLNRVENALGTRSDQKAATLELLASDALIIPDELSIRRTTELGMSSDGALMLPHPLLHMLERYLVPLAEVAPNWVHPILGQTAQALLNQHASQSPSGSLSLDRRDVAE